MEDGIDEKLIAALVNYFLEAVQVADFAKNRQVQLARSVYSPDLDGSKAFQQAVDGAIAIGAGMINHLTHGQLRRMNAVLMMTLVQEWVRSEKKNEALPKLLDLAISANRKATSAKGGSRKNAQTQKLKLNAFQWLDQNHSSCRSMEEMATCLEDVVSGRSYRTLRTWVSEWKKTNTTH